MTFLEKSEGGNVKRVAQQCTHCKKCVQECAFLSQYGTPGAICSRLDSFGEKNEKQSANAIKFIYACSLCGLCTAVCPLHLDMAAAIVTLRRRFVHHYGIPRASHQALLGYEWLGTTPLFCAEYIPVSSKTLFFPGCALAITRPEITMQIFRYLQNIIPDIGILMNCCSRPSHDLGNQTFFMRHFTKLLTHLHKKGITKIITACPSCHTTFSRYAPEIPSTLIYEILAQFPPPHVPTLFEEVSIHDTCVTRNLSSLHEDIRSLVRRCEVTMIAMPHEKNRTFCCSEGGGAAFAAPDIAQSWIVKRKREAASRHIITYCAGCSSAFTGKIAHSHLLDLLFQTAPSSQKIQKRSRGIRYFRRFILTQTIRFRQIRYFFTTVWGLKNSTK